MTKRSVWMIAAAALAVVAVVGLAVGLSAGSDGESTASGSGASTAAGRAGSVAGDAEDLRPAGTQPSGGSATPASPPSEMGPPIAPRDQAEFPALPIFLSIQSYEVLGPRRLEIRYANGVPDCFGTLGRTYAVESDGKVVVWLYRDPPARPFAGPCPEIAVVEDTVVRLSEPLGDRAVVDGADREPVRRGHLGP